MFSSSAAYFRETMTQIKYHKAPHPETGKKGYILDEDYVYYSKRYNRTKSLTKGMWSDGATGFVDLGADNVWSRLFAWLRNRVHHLKGNVKTAWFFVHDAFCEDLMWDTPYDGKCFDQPNHVWKKTKCNYYRCHNCGEEAALGEYLISNWDASTVAGDILWDAFYRFWSVPVWFATFLFGGKEIKKQNGWFRAK